jgi:hypothetical protein
VKAVSAREWFDNCGGWRPRHDLDQLRRGIAAGLLNAQDEYGMTALHLAESSGWVEGVEELLRAGADTESRYFRTGETPLLSAASDLGTANGERLNSEAVVAALVAAGASPDAANHFGQTPRKLARFHGWKVFDHVPEKPVQMPPPRIQNAEHLADHYHPRFKIPDRQERESLQPGQAVNLYVFGPESESKQDTVKVRITKRGGGGPNPVYVAVVETPLEQTHLPPGTEEVEFGPEHVATVFVPRPKRTRKRRKSE